MTIGFDCFSNEEGTVGLRPIEWRDIPNFWRLLGDPKIMDAFQRIPLPRNRAEKALISVGGVWDYKRRPFHYVILDRKDHAVGCLTFRDDGVKGEFSVSGLALLKPYRTIRRQPIIEDAFKTAVRYICDARPDIQYLKAITDVRNAKSRMMMLRAGFVETPESLREETRAPKEWRNKKAYTFEARLDLGDPRVRLKYEVDCPLPPPMPHLPLPGWGWVTLGSILVVVWVPNVTVRMALGIAAVATGCRFARDSVVMIKAFRKRLEYRSPNRLDNG